MNPLSFASILGQEAAVAALRAAVARDAVPHSLLLLGPEGVGKTTAALALAAALFCTQGRDGDACGACAHCRRIAESQHPDLTRIAPDGEFTRIWQLWSRPGHPAGALENLNFAPVSARRRVYLFEKAETLNEESANSLLKALEEPPPYVHFVLCAPSPTAVLPTILSRCQAIRFGAVPTAVIAAALTARKGLPAAEASVLAAYAEGAPGKALRLADTPEMKVLRDQLLDLAARIAHAPGIAAFRLAEELRAAAQPGKGKKGDGDAEEKSSRGDLTRAMDVLAAWYGDLLTLAVRGEDAPILHEDRRAAAIDAARRYRPAQIAENIEQLFAYRRHIARNANTQLATEVLLLRLVPKKG